MGTFTASLRSIGDVKSLPATVELNEGRIIIAAGAFEIGSWPLADVHLEEIPTGYRMAAEGEQILIELRDPTAFATELSNQHKKKHVFGRRKTDRAGRAADSPASPTTFERRSTRSR